MAQDEKALVGELIRSIDRTLKWEASAGKDGGLELTLRHARGEAKGELSDAVLTEALEDEGIGRNQLRERIKRVRRRIFTHRKPYTPWVMPKIEPIGAPGPRGGGWGGGGRR